MKKKPVCFTCFWVQQIQVSAPYYILLFHRVQQHFIHLP